MFPRKFFLMAALFCLAACSKRGSDVKVRTEFDKFCASGGSASNSQALTDSYNLFGLSLYDSLRAKPGNAFFSSYSVGAVLAMTRLGAKGKTATQLGEALSVSRVSDNYDATAASFERQVVCGANQKGYELDVANAAWGQQGFPILSAYQNQISQYYAAKMTSLDFQKQNDSATKTINHWVSDETHGMIPKLFDSLDTETRLVLTNAVYFKAKWAIPFDARDTENLAFYANGETSVQAPMMSKVDNLGYRSFDAYDVLELPYSDDLLSMVIVLPHDRKGLGGIEPSIVSDKSLSWMKTLNMTRVAVTLPKFEIAASYDLVSSLKTLGITDMFKLGLADFSGIDGASDLFVSQFIHKAHVKVGELGTEAAAASGEAMAGSAPLAPIGFVADHPFLFFIRDNSTNTILFTGRLVDPTLGA